MPAADKACSDFAAGLNVPAGRIEATASNYLCFDAVRDYIRDGVGGAASFARWYGSTELPDLPKLGEADHHIFIVSRGHSVEGVVRLFGALNYPFQLTDAYDGPSLACSYVVDPFREADPAEMKFQQGRENWVIGMRSRLNGSFPLRDPSRPSRVCEGSANLPRYPGGEIWV